MLPTSAPVSSCMRIANTGPMRLTRLLVIAVTMISRRSWCCWIVPREAALHRLREVARRARRRGTDRRRRRCRRAGRTARSWNRTAASRVRGASGPGPCGGARRSRRRSAAPRCARSSVPARSSAWMHVAELGDALGGARLQRRDREALQVVVAQHEARDLVGHAREQRDCAPAAAACPRPSAG